MKNLRPYDGDSWSIFEAIRDRRSKPEEQRILHDLSPTIRRRYGDYARHQEHLERIPDVEPPLVDIQCQVLDACYSRSPRPLEQLKERIRQRQSPEAQARCQYCGIDSPRTFDHYLPRSSFPEFSVYPANLLPCCYACNNRRSADWLEGQERAHLHLYFDAIEENEPFLVARIEIEDPGHPVARFEIDATKVSKHAFGRRYERHCRTLGLLHRFREQSAPGLDRIRTELLAAHNIQALDTSSAARSLQYQADGYRQLLGANHWEVALRVAAAESLPFIELCLNHMEPTGYASS